MLIFGGIGKHDMTLAHPLCMRKAVRLLGQIESPLDLTTLSIIVLEEGDLV